MARGAPDARLETRAHRLRLAGRREPYWRTLTPGLALGYRRARSGGTWIARAYDPPTRRRTYAALGAADDHADADGARVLTFWQAQERARAWWARRRAAAAAGGAEAEDGGHDGTPYRVADAVRDWLAAYRRGRTRGGGKAPAATEAAVHAHVLPALGDVEVAALTHHRLERWLDALASAPPRLRTAAGAAERRTRPLDAADPEALRRRRATANRVLSVLKAALNHAWQHRRARVPSRAAWEGVRPFRGADAARVRYLSDQEARRLAGACGDDLRALVWAALLTGCRYGELAAARVADLDAAARTLHVPQSKGGKARYVALSDEGVAFLRGVAADRAPGERLFLRRGLDGDGAPVPWGRSHQFRPLRSASAAAGIAPAASFHVLRHTYASRLAMRGVQMPVIAAQLGHADTRMTERHYAHLAPSYVSEMARNGLGVLGIASPREEMSLTAARGGA